MTSRVEAPTPPRAWWIASAVIAGVAWLTTATANAVDWMDGGSGIPSQFNAFGFSLAGSLTIGAMLMFALRLLRHGQRDICAAAEAATTVAVRMQESFEAMLETLATNSRATTEVCQSYARMVQEINATITPQQLRELIKARDGRLN